VYAIDVQDHGKGSAPNTNVTIENVEAVRCKHILRTANSARGHANLKLLNFTGRQCALPLQISQTQHVRVKQLTIVEHTDRKLPPVKLDRCEDVELTSVTIQTERFVDEPIKAVGCSAVKVEGLTVRP
jgi:hypothetical protein